LAIKVGFSRASTKAPFISGIIKGTSSSYLKCEDRSIT